MKLQVIIPLLVILSIGLFSNLAYGDHPEQFIVTLDKESYEYSDTIFGTGQVIAPWNSTNWDPSAGCDTYTTAFAISTLFSEGWLSTFDNQTGFITFNFTLTSDFVELGTYTITPRIVTYSPNYDRECFTSPVNHYGEPFDVIINSDPHSTLLQHIIDISIINATTQTNKADVETQRIELDQMYSHLDLIDANITSYDSRITLLDDKVDLLDITIDTLDSTIDSLEVIIDSLDNTIISLNNTVISQNIVIASLQAQIDEIMTILNDLITDPPQIISLVADDPDDLDDIYSQGDTITITFDYNTNMPGGAGYQTKSDVNNLFTFTESIGSTYRGQWITADTFVITINSVTNAAVEIGTTTVTPDGTTPILSADGISDMSFATSPILSGDFGLPVIIAN